MNLPGEGTGNWNWRMAPEALNDGAGERLGRLTWLYRRRRDAYARGLTYHLELTADLVGGSWSNSGYTETGVLILDTDFESVTNHIPVDASNKFICLKVNQR